MECVGNDIPTNEHNNIEVLRGDTSQVPKGAVFVDMRLAFQAASQLGLPCKHAVVGFERRGGMGVSVPTLRGCVCLAKDAQLVRDAAELLEVDRDERAMLKKEEKMVRNWAYLVKKMNNWQELKVRCYRCSDLWELRA